MDEGAAVGLELGSSGATAVVQDCLDREDGVPVAACSLGSTAAAGVLPLEGGDVGSTVAALELKSSGAAIAL